MKQVSQESSPARLAPGSDVPLMNNTHCRCVFPSPTEQDLATIPGPDPGTAIRVRAECGPDGYARLEQLAHDPALGWYVQKSFTIPAELVTAIAAQLRKADCLMPRPRRRGRQASHLVFPSPTPGIGDPAQPQRREA